MPFAIDVKFYSEYPWSSWHCTVGEQEPPSWLAVNQTLLQFDKNRQLAKEKYARFIREGVGKSLWGELKQQVYLGSDEFVAQHLVNPSMEVGDMKEIPAIQRRPKPLSLVKYQEMASSRNEAICAAFNSGGYTQKEIGDFFQLHYSRISRIVAKSKT